MKKIEVFLRHCYYSKIQELSSRTRPDWWNKEKVFLNFKNTLNSESTNYTIIYDEYNGKIDDTFLSQEKNVHIISGGDEAKSFLSTFDYILKKNFDEDTIIYFLEDDYVHRPKWDIILQEGFTLPASYVTLYDHPDKYTNKIKNGISYAELKHKIFTTSNSHWRTTISTTCTFATKFKTLKEDKEIHQKYSTNTQITRDSLKFIELNKMGRSVVSCLPGYSTHAAGEYVSPFINWSDYLL